MEKIIERLSRIKILFERFKRLICMRTTFFHYKNLSYIFMGKIKNAFN